MTPKEIISRLERIRVQVDSFTIPFYTSKIAPLKRMAAELVVLVRELTWRVDDLESAKDKSNEGKSS